MEEYAYVLDYLPAGPSKGKFDKPEDIIYALGDGEFKLFELVAKKGAKPVFDDRVYIGKDASKRTIVDHVKRRIGYDDLTSVAVGELEAAVKAAVDSQEDRFVSFYNRAGPVSVRKHLLEELPGLGKKSMEAILAERKRGDFKSFADLAERVPGVKDPAKLVVARILLEIEDPNRKRYLFVQR